MTMTADERTQLLETVRELTDSTEQFKALKKLFPRLSLTVSRAGTSNKWNGLRYRYACVLKRGENRYGFPFYDSIRNYQTGDTPSKIEVLGCILSDASCYNSSLCFSDFCSSFGYSEYDEDTGEENKEAVRIWEACKKTAYAIDDMFTGDEREELFDIVREWGY